MGVAIHLKRRRLYLALVLTLVCVAVPVKYLHVSEPTFYFSFSELLSSPGVINQTDPLLVDLIATEFLHPPSILPYHLTEPVKQGQVGQAKAVDKFFNEKTDGFFIEAGAFNGEYLSNTLFLETNRNWTGLLVEPNKVAFQGLLTKQRKAWSINSCLSIHKYPEQMTFDGADVYGGVVSGDVRLPSGLLKMRDTVPTEKRNRYTVQCLPLYSILLALGNPTVDLLSLDVEGAELAVLRTLPWEEVNIRSVVVEVEHSDHKSIKKLMDRAGYVVHKGLKTDIMFVKSDLAESN